MRTRHIVGEEVMISGFGKWLVKCKHARRGRETSEHMMLDAQKVVIWSCSPVLKKAVNTPSLDAKRVEPDGSFSGFRLT